jgi:hypothetical protein
MRAGNDNGRTNPAHIPDSDPFAETLIPQPVMFTGNSYRNPVAAGKLLIRPQLPFEARHATDYQNMD